MGEINGKILSAIASGTLLVAAFPAVQALSPNAAGSSEGADAVPLETAGVSKTVASVPQRTVSNIEGKFTWNQEALLSNDRLAKVLYRASDYRCGAQGDEPSEAGVSITSIEVKGDVGRAFAASIAEYRKKAPAKKIMSCTCSGNQANGRASANALASGFMLKALIEDAQPASDVNTITFVSADGYEVSLPLAYVLQRFSIVVTDVNGEATEDALGCSNQVWLGSTAARTFARDVVAIELTHESQVPAVPSTKDLNQPNVGILEGGAA